MNNPRKTKKDLIDELAELRQKVIQFEQSEKDHLQLIRELTERKCCEEALQKSADHSNRAQRIAKVGSWERNIVNNEVYWSDEFYRILGLKPAECKASYEIFLSHIHPEDREFVNKSVEEALYKNKPYDINFRIARLDGVKCIVHAQGVVDFDSLGSPVRISGTLHDITERKIAEEKAWLAEKRFHSLVENSGDAICIFDIETHKHVYANQAATKLLGYTIYEFLRMKTDDLIGPEHIAGHLESYKRLNAGSSIRVEEKMALTKDGTTIYIDVTAFTIQFADQKLAVAILRDVSDQRRSKQALLERTEELRLLNKELNELTIQLTIIEEHERKRFAEILHERIGQNLTAARTMYATSLNHCHFDNNVTRERMHQILSLMDESIKTTRTMTAEIYPSSIDAIGLNSAVKWHVENVLGAAGIHGILDIDDDIEHALTKETQQVVFSMIRECLQNVVKYSSATEVNLTYTRDKELVRISVKDNGTGFSVEDIKTRPGRGFGLILMREWAKSVNGSFLIESSIGEGARITMEFPAPIKLQ